MNQDQVVIKKMRSVSCHEIESIRSTVHRKRKEINENFMFRVFRDICQLICTNFNKLQRLIQSRSISSGKFRKFVSEGQQFFQRHGVSFLIAIIVMVLERRIDSIEGLPWISLIWTVLQGNSRAWGSMNPLAMGDTHEIHSFTSSNKFRHLVYANYGMVHRFVRKYAMPLAVAIIILEYACISSYLELLWHHLQAILTFSITQMRILGQVAYSHTRPMS